ncbi:Reactive oxygen species modulator 1 [Takifugu flavidus]|nr:Reactive oxygen species modulator 1 [Takifugu flavidus]
MLWETHSLACSSDAVRWGQRSRAPAVRLPSFLQLPLFPVTGHECLLVARRFKRSRTKIHDKCFHREDLPDIYPIPDTMPVAVGPYGQTQPSCFDRVKMGFMMGFAVGMAAGAMFGTFSCLRIGMRGRELMGGVGKTMMQSGGTFGTFMAIGMGIRC